MTFQSGLVRGFVRVVSLVPSHTESVFELGCGDLVVGRTRFCIFPEEVNSIPHVGGTKDADFEKIMALQPDLVLADKDENPLALVESLQAAGVEVLWSDIERVDDVGPWLLTLGAAIDADLSTISSFVPEISPPTTLLPVFCPIWYPWMTFDGSAYPSAMLAAAGFRNVFSDHDGDKYFECSLEDAVEAGAEVALLPTEPFPFHKQTKDTSPLPNVIIDGEALTWFGTRTKRGVKELEKVRLSLSQGHEGNQDT